LYHVYVLKSDVTGRFYTGSCEDLEGRLAWHNAGECLATRHGVPWRLVHSEQFATRSEAIRRERFLKTGSGRNKLRRAYG
jgi:putative endonuclease